MTKIEWMQIFTAASTFLSALAAWWSKRSNKQLQPKPGRKERVAEAARAKEAGEPVKEVTVRDIALGALDETVRLGERVNRVETHLGIKNGDGE